MWALCQVLPGLAAVDAAPQSAIRPAAADLPEGAMCLPDGRVEDAWVGLVETEIDRSGCIADEKDVAPGRAAVVALEHAALRIGTEGVSQRRDPHDIRVVRVDANLADVARFTKADVPPASSGVGTSIDAVTVRDVDADGGLASAGIDNVRVGRRYGQGSDRGGGEEPIGHGPPVCSGIGRFPDAAGDSAEIERAGIMPCAGYGNDAATAERSDAAPPEQPLEIELLNLGHGRIPSTSGWRYRNPRVTHCPQFEVRVSRGA
jgi:hypothetical protein